MATQNTTTTTDAAANGSCSSGAPAPTAKTNSNNTNTNTKKRAHPGAATGPIDMDPIDAEIKRCDAARHAESIRRAREAHKAKSPPRWHTLVLSDGSTRLLWTSSSSSLLRGRAPS
jgi:hypothetical protein